MKRGNKPSYEQDMTQGPILPGILMFSIPLILSGVLQLLYNAADIMVVGRFAGAQSLAAVGSTSSLINLMVNLFIGISLGASVVTARDYGARDSEAVRQDVHTAVTIALGAGIVLGILGNLVSRPLLLLMGSPEDVIDLATLYVKIYFCGMPFNLLYNFGAAELRAVGDTRRPLYFLTLSGLVNVVLNLILVIGFHMDVAGVAIATVASQGVSMALVLQALIRSEGATHLDMKKLGINGRSVRQILKMGLPAGLQSSLFALSNVIIQSSVNSFGSLVMAGNSAAGSIEGFVYTSMNAIAQADMTFASQNMGAGRYSRVRRTLVVCSAVVTVVGLTVGGIVLFFGRDLTRLYNTDPQVVEYALIRMQIIITPYFICGLMDVLSSHMRGIGSSILPMIVSLTGACLLRIVWIMTIFAANRSLIMLYLSYPITWSVTTLAHLITYRIYQRRIPRTDRAAEAV